MAESNGNQVDIVTATYSDLDDLAGVFDVQAAEMHQDLSQLSMKWQMMSAQTSGLTTMDST